MIFPLFFKIFSSDINIWVHNTIETNNRTTDTLYTCFQATVLDNYQKHLDIPNAHVSTRDLNLKGFNVTKAHFQDPQKMIENNQTRLFFSTLFGLKDQLCSYWELSGKPGKKGDKKIQAIWCGRDTLKQFKYGILGQKQYFDNKPDTTLWLPDAPHVTCDIDGKKSHTILLHDFSMDGISYEDWHQNHYQHFTQALAVKTQAEREKAQKTQAELYSKNRQLQQAQTTNQALYRRSKSAADIERRLEAHKKISHIERLKTLDAQNMSNKNAHEAKVANDQLEKSKKRTKSLQARNSHLAQTNEELKAQLVLWKKVAEANKRNNQETISRGGSKPNRKGRNVSVSPGPGNRQTDTIPQQEPSTQLHRGRSPMPKPTTSHQRTPSPGGLFAKMKKGFLNSGFPSNTSIPTNTHPENKSSSVPDQTATTHERTSFISTELNQMDVVIHNTSLDTAGILQKLENIATQEITRLTDPPQAISGSEVFQKWHDLLIKQDQIDHRLNIDNPLINMDLFFQEQSYTGQRVIEAFIHLAEQSNAKILKTNKTDFPHASQMRPLFESTKIWLVKMEAKSFFKNEIITGKIQEAILRIDWIADIWNGRKPTLIDLTELDEYFEKKGAKKP